MSDDATSEQFTPFNDTDIPRIDELVVASQVTTDGMDTRPFDAFRQGVSVTTSAHRFGSTQPKMGSGNLNHVTKVITNGQPRDFTQFTGERKFTETQEFNPVEFLEGQDYTMPLYFNEGLQQSEEARVEPLTIPSVGYGAPTQAYRIHDIHANIEDGNEDTIPGKGNTRIEQAISYVGPTRFDPFLDEGMHYIGNGNLDESIRIEGFVDENVRVISPFSDIEDEEIVRNQVRTTDPDLIAALLALDYDLSEDIRGSFGKKSATAGTYTYGPNAARYGTDSIVYNNLVRGA